MAGVWLRGCNCYATSIAILFCFITVTYKRIDFRAPEMWHSWIEERQALAGIPAVERQDLAGMRQHRGLARALQGSVFRRSRPGVAALFPAHHPPGRSGRIVTAPCCRTRFSMHIITLPLVAGQLRHRHHPARSWSPLRQARLADRACQIARGSRTLPCLTSWHVSC